MNGKNSRYFKVKMLYMSGEPEYICITLAGGRFKVIHYPQSYAAATLYNAINGQRAYAFEYITKEEAFVECL